MVRGFCSGTFSYLHYGHVLFFKDCKKYCDHLTVMIGSDYSIKTKYNINPPISLKNRLGLISELRCVDTCFADENSALYNNPLSYLYEVLLRLNQKDFIYFFNEDAFSLEDRIRFCELNKIQYKILSRKNNDSGISSSQILSIKNKNY